MTDSIDGQHTAERVSFHDERIKMSHWYPRVQQLDIPTLPTETVAWKRDTDGPPEWSTRDVVTAVERLGGDVHIRSGYKSPQHVDRLASTDPTVVDKVLAKLLEDHLMRQMPVGDSLWLREWVDLDFLTYESRPCHPEVRVIIRNGEVVCHHLRVGWPHRERAAPYRSEAEDIMTQAWDDTDDENDWYWEPDEGLKTYAERVAAEFGGMWSVDFVCTTDGEWYLTDMALDAVYKRDGDLHGVSGHPTDCDHDWDV